LASNSSQAADSLTRAQLSHKSEPIRRPVYNFDQTHQPAAHYNCAFLVARCVMFTSAECREYAEQKLAQAEHDHGIGGGSLLPPKHGLISLA
jgi:hypothetical protein